MKNTIIVGIVSIALLAIGFTLYKAIRKTDTLPQNQEIKKELEPAAAVDSSEGKVTTIKNKSEFEALIQKNPAVVVKLSATWCPPCNAMKPIYNRLSIEMGEKLTFTEIDVDQFQESQIFNARGIPAFIIYKNGKEDSRVIGSRTQAELKTELLKAL